MQAHRTARTSTKLAWPILAFATIFAFATFATAQDPPKSPPATAMCKLPDGKTINTAYSSPRLRGRKMLGEHDPYGKVWRMGANEATTFVTDTNLTIAGKNVPAGSYTLFAIPNTDQWTLIINKKTGEWGIPYKYESDELARVPMKVSTLPSKMENFTISYEPAGDGCTLNADWDMMRASVHIAEQK